MPSDSSVNEAREDLSEIRESLIHLHKALVDFERVNYEKTFGSIASPRALLKLLIQDSWFAWLHPLSELIVLIDEALDAKEPFTPEIASNLTKQVRTLLIPTEEGVSFGKHYFEALQADPDVVLAHAELRRKLRSP
jgi:hypothetical protein